MRKRDTGICSIQNIKFITFLSQNGKKYVLTVGHNGIQKQTEQLRNGSQRILNLRPDKMLRRCSLKIKEKNKMRKGKGSIRKE